jgi:hypothetical protein
MARPQVAGRSSQLLWLFKIAIVALSNGNLSMLTDLFAAAGLTWHCMLSGEMVHAYKASRAAGSLQTAQPAL